MLIGRMQDQQMSVIGLGNLPVQVAMPAAIAECDESRRQATRKRRRRIIMRAPSSMRRRRPSCETMAGTAVMPNLRTSVPSWS
jgi:hypothetical protein